jgi:hypothetical protein
MNKIRVSLIALICAFFSGNIFAQVNVVSIVESIPSPIEVAFLVKDLGAEYKKANMNGHEKVDAYSTNYKKALNLGVYSADLGFANLYKKNQDAINYLNSIQKLADGLKIGQHFDSNTIKKLLQNDDNMDELLKQTNQNLEKINNSLAERKQDYLSILLVTGGWLEAAYLMTLVQKEKPNAKLKERIGEQKIVLDEIMKGLEAHKSQQGFAQLITDMKKLKAAFDQVTITVKKGKDEMQVVNGELKVVSTTVSTVNISDAALTNISNAVASLRNEIVK